MKEIWKDIPGYEGLYKASDLGRIKSATILSTNVRKVTKYFKKGRIMSLGLTVGGYYRVRLSKDGKATKYVVHRLILLTFVGNPPEDKPQCLHLNHNKLDNNIKNLRWGSQSENIKMDFDHGRRKSFMTGNFNYHKFSYPVIKCSIDGETLERFPSMMEASRQTGIASSTIALCCRGGQKTTRGFIFKRVVI